MPERDRVTSVPAGTWTWLYRRIRSQNPCPLRRLAGPWITRRGSSTPPAVSMSALITSVVIVIVSLRNGAASFAPGATAAPAAAGAEGRADAPVLAAGAVAAGGGGVSGGRGRIAAAVHP
jgi:hypothetical protein